MKSDDLHILADELAKLNRKEKEILLDQLRKEINKIDSRIAAQLVKRINVVIEIGMIKKSMGLSTYDAQREKEIESNIKKEDDSSINKALKNIYERIIDESRAIQREKEK